MKKLFLTFALAIGMSVAVNAQQIVKRFNPFSVEVLDKLSATIEQKKMVEEQTKEHVEKLAALRKNKNLSDEERKTEHQKLNRERSRKLYYDVLTPEQAKLLREMSVEERKKRNNK